MSRLESMATSASRPDAEEENTPSPAPSVQSAEISVKERSGRERRIESRYALDPEDDEAAALAAAAAAQEAAAQEAAAEADARAAAARRTVEAPVVPRPVSRPSQRKRLSRAPSRPTTRTSRGPDRSLPCRLPRRCRPSRRWRETSPTTSSRSEWTSTPRSRSRRQTLPRPSRRSCPSRRLRRPPRPRPAGRATAQLRHSGTRRIQSPLRRWRWSAVGGARRQSRGQPRPRTPAGHAAVASLGGR